MQISDDLRILARILADWAEGRAAIIYLYGSRVRGDNRPDSDVDIHIRWETDIDNSTTLWWTDVKYNEFVSINKALPGPLQILEPQDPLHYTVEYGPVIYEDRNVKCVLLPPK